MNRVLRYFLAGLMSLLPFVVTVAIVTWCANFLLTYVGPDTSFGKLLMSLGVSVDEDTILAYIFGWIIVLTAIFVLGVVVEKFAMRLIPWGDALFKKIPIVGTIYDTTRKFTNLLQANNNQEFSNMLPVYCRFGSEGGTLLLALQPTKDEIMVKGVSYKIVVIPTAPLPFGGAMVLVPSANVFSAEMTVNDLMSFYISMGVNIPHK